MLLSWLEPKLLFSHRLAVSITRDTYSLAAPLPIQLLVQVQVPVLFYLYYLRGVPLVASAQYASYVLPRWRSTVDSGLYCVYFRLLLSTPQSCQNSKPIVSRLELYEEDRKWEWWSNIREYMQTQNSAIFSVIFQIAEKITEFPLRKTRKFEK